MARGDIGTKGDLRVLLQGDIEVALKEVDRLPKDVVLNEDPGKVILKIVTQVAQSPIVLQWEARKFKDTREVKIPGDDFGRPVQVNGLAKDIHIPTSGALNLLRYKASQSFVSSLNWKIEGSDLVLTVAAPNLTDDFVKSEYERSRTQLIQVTDWVNQDLAQNHTQMSGQVNARLHARREMLTKAAKLDEDLDSE